MRTKTVATPEKYKAVPAMTIGYLAAVAPLCLRCAIGSMQAEAGL